MADPTANWGALRRIHFEATLAEPIFKVAVFGRRANQEYQHRE
jgi:hypothetical protein